MIALKLMPMPAMFGSSKKKLDTVASPPSGVLSDFALVEALPLASVSVTRSNKLSRRSLNSGSAVPSDWSKVFALVSRSGAVDQIAMAE